MAEEKDREKKFAKDFLEKWVKAEREEEPAEDALAREDEAVRKNPNDAQAWFRRGTVLADLSRWADALASLERAEGLDPTIARLQLAKAYVLIRLGRADEAAEAQRRALGEAAASVDAGLAEVVSRKEEIEEALTALADDLRREKTEAEAVRELEALEHITKEPIPPAEEDFETRAKRWESEGYDVAPLREALEKDPDRVRTVFFQFEQNLKKVEILRDTVNALDTGGIEEDVARLRRLFRSPYQIWRIEAEMSTLLEKAEERDRRRRARVAPPAARVVARPRVPGAVNGRRLVAPPGRVNGLINGVRTARAGLTNGLTNGLGFTNGLAGRRLVAETRPGRSRLLLVPLAAVLLLSVTLVVGPGAPPAIGGVTIDGEFLEWQGVPGYAQASTTTNPNVDLLAYKVLHQEGHLSLYAEVRGTLFSTTGGLHLLYAFVDADGDNSTGYDEGRLGADFLLEIRGGNESVMSTHTWRWTPGEAPDDWNGWKGSELRLNAESSGARLEAQASTDRVDGFDPTVATLVLHLDDQLGSRSASALVVGPTFGALEVHQEAVDVRVNPGVSDFLNLTFRAVGAPVQVSDIDFARGSNTRPILGFTSLSLAADETRTVTLAVDATGQPSGTLLEAEVQSVVSDVPVTLVGAPARAYVGVAPAGKVVDGLFAEWTDVRTDAGTVSNPNVDVEAHAAEVQTATAYVYVQVSGQALGGHPAPVSRMRPSPGPSGPPGAPPLPERRVGEDRVLVYFDATGVAGGVPVNGIEADTLLDIRGRNGKLRSVASFAWDRGWVSRGVADARVADTELEGSLSVSGVDLTAARYIVETWDWRGLGERTAVEGVRGVHVTPDQVRFSGSANVILPGLATGSVRFEAPGALGLSWSLPDILRVEPAGDTVIGTPRDVPPLVEGYRALYRDAFEGLRADVVYDSSLAGLKELIVLEEPPTLLPGDSLRLDFSFQIEGDLMVHASGTTEGTALLVDGDLAFVDGRGVSFVMPSPWAQDARGDRLDLRYNLDGATIGITVSADWLLAASFPVVIDPTVTYTLRNDGASYKAGEQMGYSAAIGDFNGDGYADVLTGAPQNSLGGTAHGYAYIYYGPFAANDSTPDVWINGTTASVQFGFSVAAGRFNNDAYWDALIARRSNPGLVGDVSIYYGSASWSGYENTSDVDFTPPANPRNFGWAVAAGNVNNADYDDVLIGEPGRDNNSDSLSDGVVYLYLSPFSSTESTADFTLYPSTDGAGQMGRSLAVGKIDSDDYPDVLAGEPTFSSNRGRVQFFKGISFASGSGSRSPNATLTGPSAGEQFGTSVAIGLLNGDAYNDVVVGAPYKTSEAGAAYVFLANSNGTGLTTGASPDVTLSNQSSGERFGVSLVVVDFDDDGSAGIAVGAPYANAGGTRKGRVYWFDDPLNDQTPDETLTGDQNEERLGQSLAWGKFSSDVRTILAIGGYLWDKIPGNPTDNDGRVLLADIPEPAAMLVAVMFLVALSGRSVQRRRLVRKR